MQRICLGLICLALCVTEAIAQTPRVTSAPSDSEIRHILSDREIASLGALQSVDFKGVGPGGSDIYRLKFEHGLIEWRLYLDADGKIATQFWHHVSE